MTRRRIGRERNEFMSKIQAIARVQIVVEVLLDQPWGEDCSIGQLYKQAAESGRTHLINALKQDGHRGIRIFGEPKIIGVLSERID